LEQPNAVTRKVVAIRFNTGHLNFKYSATAFLGLALIEEKVKTDIGAYKLNEMTA